MFIQKEQILPKKLLCMLLNHSNIARLPGSPRLPLEKSHWKAVIYLGPLFGATLWFCWQIG